MRRTKIVFILLFLVLYIPNAISQQKNPVGNPGQQLVYSLSKSDKPAGSVVSTLDLTVGETEQVNGKPFQWLQLTATKENSETFSCWMLCSEYPSKNVKSAESHIARFILQQGHLQPVEFTHYKTKKAVLPTTGAWEYLLPRSEKTNPVVSLAKTVHFLGHEYKLEKRGQSDKVVLPADPHVVTLSPDLITGVPHNTRQKDETRRYDESDYEYIRLTKTDYMDMIEAGLNCFRVDAEQVKWIERSDVYYWGIGGVWMCLIPNAYIKVITSARLSFLMNPWSAHGTESSNRNYKKIRPCEKL